MIMKANRNWKYLEGEECPRCGGSAEVYTEAKNENEYYDQESVQCSDCKLTGLTNVDGDDEDNGIGSVQWDNDYDA